MKISEIAKQTGLSTKTIRYYERIGLVDSPPRQDNGYREYAAAHVQQLGFLRHARQFGFSIEECRELLNLWANPNRRSAEVCSLVTDKVRDIEKHIRELRNMKKVLTELLAKCPGDDNPECAIIDQLALNKDESL